MAPSPSRTFAAHCLGAEASDRPLRRWRLELPRQLRGRAGRTVGPWTLGVDLESRALGKGLLASWEPGEALGREGEATAAPRAPGQS